MPEQGKKKGGLLGALANLEIFEITDDAPGPPSGSGAEASNATASPIAAPVALNASSESVDAGMVAKIRAAVTAATHAPRLTSFLANLETARAAFPNNEQSAINAALAFSKLTSADIREELSKAVAAALIEAENKIKGDIRQQRQQLATELDAETEKHRANIAALEEQIRTLQGQLGTAQTALSKIDSTRTQRTTKIDASESTALASLRAVKAELDSLSNQLP